jgi:putative MATE family efflux protein
LLLHVDTERLKVILTLGLPIIGGMLSQSLLNLVDTAMVGTLGGNALAGVGVGGYATFLAMALIMGLSSGVQAMVARRRGEQRSKDTAVPLNGGLLLSLLICLPLTLLFLNLSAPLVRLISTESEIVDIASPYFDYRIMAMLAVGLNLSFRGYWNGINQPMVYLRVLVSVHIANVLISYGLIFGEFGLPEMGAVGAGIGTTVALYLGSVIYLILTFRQARPHGFLHSIPDSATLRSMLQLSIPNSLQQFFFAASICVLFWIIGQIGIQELAIAHVLTLLALFLILPAVGLGMAATTLVSHSLGSQHYTQACEWGWDVVKVATLILILLSLPMWFFPESILGLFLHDEDLIQRARLPLQVAAAAICIDTTAIVFTQALLGAGANRSVMAVTTIGQWCFYLPLAWLVGPYLGGGLIGIWLVQLVHRAFSSLVFAAIWRRQKWTSIKL